MLIRDRTYMKMKALRYGTTLFIFAVSVLPQFAFADGSRATAQAPQKSENFDKTKKFLPGEEVISPTGQKMKIWSTEGPVQVSPPPQPFDDPSKQALPPNAHIVVDESNLGDLNFRRGNNPGANSPQAPTRGENIERGNGGRDSFDVDSGHNTR
jgi:hypothetical protein